MDRNFVVEGPRSSEVVEVRNYLAVDSHHVIDRHHTLVLGRRTWFEGLGFDATLACQMCGAEYGVLGTI